MIHEKHGTADPIKFCKLTYFDTLYPSAPCSMPNTPRGPLFGANVKRLGILVHSTYLGLGALSAYLGKGKSVTLSRKRDERDTRTKNMCSIVYLILIYKVNTQCQPINLNSTLTMYTSC